VLAGCQLARGVLHLQIGNGAGEHAPDSYPPRRAPSRKASDKLRCTKAEKNNSKTGTRPTDELCIVTTSPATLPPDVVPQTMGGAPPDIAYRNALS